MSASYLVVEKVERFMTVLTTDGELDISVLDELEINIKPREYIVGLTATETNQNELLEMVENYEKVVFNPKSKYASLYNTVEITRL